MALFTPKTISTSVYGKDYSRDLIICSDGNRYKCDFNILGRLRIGALYEFETQGLNIPWLGIYPKVIKTRFLHD